MIVLSLFDGISAGQLALERAGIKVDKYYTSEIDKNAIKITQKNFPNTIQLGDINGWENWNIEQPDLILAGSPCQGFSKAGSMLNFTDPRSKLFFVFLEILNYYLPKYFLLENVKMKKEWANIISDLLGIEPLLINSALVSAQTRERYYWTNIPQISELKDKDIYLKDILLSGETWRDKALCVDSNYYKGGSIKALLEHGDRFQSARRLQVVELSEKEMAYMDRVVKDGRNHWDFKHYSDSKNNKSSAIVANFFKGVPYNVLIDGKCIRKFHPIECERLQTFPDNYTEGISNTQRYKCLGNSWTVDVIVHLLEGILYEDRKD